VEEEKDNLRFYDYLVVGLFSDVSAGVVMSILGGNIFAIHLIPLLIIGWLSYENFRLWVEKRNGQK
jgi:hypothetical protein